MAINIPDDFTGPTEGTFTTTGGSNGRGGSYTLPAGTTVKADQLTEGQERFKIQIRLGGPSGPVVAERTVTVGDTSQTLYTLTPSVTTVFSGQTVTFTFTTTGPNGTFYWQDAGTMAESSFSPAVKTGQFTTTGTGTTKTGTFTRRIASTVQNGNMVIRIYAQDPVQNPGAQPLQNGATVLSSTVAVADDSGAFVLLIQTNASGSEYGTYPATGTNQFRFYGQGSYQVDWGDGTAPINYSNITSHVDKTYATAGTYEIRVRNWTGSTRRHRVPYTSNTDAAKIRELRQWGATQWTSCEEMFEFAINMIGTFSDAPNLSAPGISMRYMFYYCRLFNGSPNASMNSWDMGNVTNMYIMFYKATAFNQPIGNWNVSNVTTMYAMFFDARAFNQPIGNWNVGKVTNMGDMFNSATAFNQPIGNWNVSNVTNMSYMFYSATAFNQPIGNWNVSNVTDMGGMFWAAGAFNQPIGNWNVSNVTNMSSMFQQTYVFNQPIGNWNVSKVTNMTAMFHQANSFNQSLGTWTLNSSVNLSSMLGTVSPTLGMDPENYSRTLIGWSNNPSTPNSRSLGALNRRHTNAVYGTGARTTGTAARSHLTTSTGGGGRGWSISTTDDAQITYNLYAPVAASVDEGASVTYTLGITGSASNDPFRLGTFYWTNSGTTSAADFAAGSNGGAVTAVSVDTTRGQAQLTRTLASDLLTEGAETVVIQFRTGSLEGTVLQSATTTVNDTSNRSSLLVSALVGGVLAPVTSVEEGAVLTYSFTTEADDGVFYWTVGAEDGLDLAQGAQGSFPVTPLEGQPGMYGGQFSVETLLDQVTEGSENLVMSVRKGGTGGSAVASVPVTVVDTSFDQYALTPGSVSVNETSSTNSVTLTFTTTGLNGGPGGAGFFWTTAPVVGTVNGSDFTDGAVSGPLTVTGGANGRGGSGQIVRTLRTDQLTEGQEEFDIEVRTGSTSGPVVATSRVTVGDTSKTLYTLTPSVTMVYSVSVSTVEFTFTTTGPNGTFYWRQDEGTLTGSDFVGGAMSGEFMTTGTGTTKTGTFTRTLASPTDGSMVIRIYAQDPVQNPGAEPLKNGDTTLSGAVTVSTNQALGDFVLEIRTNEPVPSGLTRPTGTSTNTFRFYGRGSYQVDWGDGTAPVNYSNITSHVDKTYATAGTYTIRVRNWTAGTGIPIRHASPESTTTDAFKILKIVQWGTTQWASCSNMFSYARNMIGTFSDAPNLTAPNISMYYMFYDCALFNGSPNASMNSWDVSNVTSMFGMFYNATAFNQPIGNWNVSKVTDMSYMFWGATAFNQNLGSWVLNSSVAMYSMLDTSSTATGMSTENYSRTLIGWANNVSSRGGVPSSRSLGASGRRYSTVNYGGSPYSTGASARSYLVSRGWLFSGDAAGS